jgi:hypothetical protein
MMGSPVFSLLKGENFNMGFSVTKISNQGILLNENAPPKRCPQSHHFFYSSLSHRSHLMRSKLFD